MLTVNCFSRCNYALNHKPRRTDGGNLYGTLIRLGKGRDVCLAPYDPQIHRVWELVNVGDNVLRPCFIDAVDPAELEQARSVAIAAGLFHPAEDTRKRILAAVVRRVGRPASAADCWPPMIVRALSVDVLSRRWSKQHVSRHTVIRRRT